MILSTLKPGHLCCILDNTFNGRPAQSRLLALQECWPFMPDLHRQH